MNSIPRLLLVCFSIFTMCAIMAHFLFTRGAALALDRDILGRGDAIYEAADYDSDFSDYDKKTECLDAGCNDVANCTSGSHEHVVYYTKTITGSEVLRLASKYHYTIKGKVLVRNDRTTREYSDKYPYIKNSINNIDYIEPTDNYIAKVIMSKGKPYTMYFYYDGYQLYNKAGLTKVEPLYFKKGGHDYSLFQQFTESGEYNVPDGSNFMLYACASGKDTDAGQAIAGVKVTNCSKVIVEINYKGNTVIKLLGRGGVDPIVSRQFSTAYLSCVNNYTGYATITLQAGKYKDSYLNEKELESATDLFRAYSAGEDGADGYDGSIYFISGDTYSVGPNGRVFAGGKGGEGGAYGFGGAGGNGGYEIIVGREVNKFTAYQNNPLGGGAGYAASYAGINYAKLKNLLPVSFGGIVTDESSHSDYSYTSATSGSNGTLLYGGNGGTAGLLYSDEGAMEGQDTAAAGGGGGGGGYGAGGGAGGTNVGDEPSAESGTPSGGMVYISFK